MSFNQPSKQWNPAQYTLGSPKSNKYSIVILNQPLENKDLLIKLCAGATLIACADGGANRLKDLALEGQEERDCRPNAICGDMDSLYPEVEKYYRELEVQIILDPDQYSTDLRKCLKYINEHEKYALRKVPKMLAESTTPNNHASDVILIGGLGGRADQAFSLLHELYRSYEDPSMNNDLYLITPESIVFLLEKGSNTIQTPIGAELLTKYVGIIPVGRPSTITTRGLEWDIKDWNTEFGTQVSTSNHVVNDVIEVQSTERVLCTIGIALKLPER